jgi:hypothetical protein
MTYFTAGLAGHDDKVQSGSLRQVKRYAAKFNSFEQQEREIEVFQHEEGHEPKRVASRRLKDRYWKQHNGSY